MNRAERRALKRRGDAKGTERKAPDASEQFTWQWEDDELRFYRNGERVPPDEEERLRASMENALE